MGFLGKTISTIYKKFHNASGKSLELKSEIYKGDIQQSEIYQNNGVFSRVPKNVKHISIPINNNKGHLITIAFHNENVDLDGNVGSTLIYSTNENGDEIKAKILLDIDGKIGMSNSAEQISSLVSDLIDAIIDIQTFGAPSQHILKEVSKLALNDMKTRFSDLLKGT